MFWDADYKHKPNASSALESMRKCCMMEDARCCNYLSAWFMGQRGRRKTKKVSDEQFAKEPGSLPENMVLALEYGIKACQLGESTVGWGLLCWKSYYKFCNPKYCPFQSCVNVARMYELGDGIPKDAQQSNKYKEMAKDIVENVDQNLSISASG